MESSLSSSRGKRWGVLLGTALTLTCFTASTVAARSLVHSQIMESADVILFAVKVVAALVLARLAIICALATQDVLRAETATPRSTSSGLFAQSRSRHRLAGWLLAVAATFGPSAASASTPTSISTSIAVAPNSHNDPFLSLESHQEASPKGQAQPHNVASLKDDALCATVPEPDWTLPTTMSPLGCRILGGGGAPSQLSNRSTHVVQRGETVWGIAASYLPRSAGNAQVAASVRAWVKANPVTLAHPDLVQVGDTLTIPTV